MLGQKNRGEPVNGTQGSPEVVGDRVRERFQLPVRNLEVCGPLRDAGFEFLVEPAVVALDILEIRDVHEDSADPDDISLLYDRG